MNFISTITTTLQPLNGKTFDSKDDLDDALYPFFGPLQSMFTGKGHRDLADHLLNLGWVKKENGKLVLRMPVQESATERTTQRSLTYAELEVLLKIGMGSAKGSPATAFFGQEQIIDKLISSGFVEYADQLDSPMKTFDRQLITSSVDAALQYIKDRNYYAAITALEVAAKKSDSLQKEDWVYRLTADGEEIKSKLSSATIKF
jgi:hypothetical protein